MEEKGYTMGLDFTFGKVITINSPEGVEIITMAYCDDNEKSQMTLASNLKNWLNKEAESTKLKDELYHALTNVCNEYQTWRQQEGFLVDCENLKIAKKVCVEYEGCTAAAPTCQ